MIHCAAFVRKEATSASTLLLFKKRKKEGKKRKSKQSQIPYIHGDWTEQRKMLTSGLWKVHLHNPKMKPVIRNTSIYVPLECHYSEG